MKIDIAQLEYIHRLLRRVLLDTEARHGELTITSQYRIGDKGVHGTLPLRAHDIRCRDDDTGMTMENAVNERWQYDPDRPHMKVCMYHDTGLGKHLHFQVSDKTIRKH